MSTYYKDKYKGQANPHWRGGDVFKVCPQCGKDFNAGMPSVAVDRIYCSVQCNAASKTTTNNTCKECGAPISSNYIHCDNCKRKQVNVRNFKKCKSCGITIKSNYTYCKNCSPSIIGKILTACRICGKTFEHYPSEKKIYCSNDCRNKGRYSDGNPNWKGGKLSISSRVRACDKNKKLIAMMLRRDKYTCQLCGQVGGILEVDHIKPFSDIMDEFLNQFASLDINLFAYELSLIALKYKPFWDKNNMRVLCKSCNWKRQVERNKERPAGSPRY